MAEAVKLALKAILFCVLLLLLDFTIYFILYWRKNELLNNKVKFRRISNYWKSLKYTQSQEHLFESQLYLCFCILPPTEATVKTEFCICQEKENHKTKTVGIWRSGRCA